VPTRSFSPARIAAFKSSVNLSRNMAVSCIENFKRLYHGVSYPREVIFQLACVL
jgi:hypothetical protein